MERFLQKAEIRDKSLLQSRSYPFSIPAIRKMGEVEFHPQATFFIGENGSGKSTLLEGIAVQFGFNPEGGTRNFNFSTYASHSELWRHLRLTKGISRPKDGFFFRAESFYNVATEIENLSEEGMGRPIRESYGGNLHNRSHGESFFALLQNRLGGHGLYLFDEPEAALSPLRQLAMLRRMRELAENGSQLIIATHSPILLAYPDCWIYEFSQKGIRRVEYEETEQFRITRDFLNNYPKALEELFHE
ncbi:MAG TPA: AAA family ATPase [Candidatus Merdivicinus excrementipullorum]|uniref:AAA family ATPase n=1 Tax=Candidatus Merdivicinus excrementipullorum TaxID=2840867 RepID=A0A9D1FQA0_9FIRM|nr:AAA family ATPase [Candidatus Merdivicinus excrementipullorum]